MFSEGSTAAAKIKAFENYFKAHIVDYSLVSISTPFWAHACHFHGVMIMSYRRSLTRSIAWSHVKVMQNSMSLTYSLPSQRIAAQHMLPWQHTTTDWPLSLDCNTQKTGIQKRGILRSPFFSSLGTREVFFKCARLLGHFQISHRDVTNEIRSVVIWNEAP